MDLNPECKLFIGGLNKQTELSSLREHFEQWGELVDSVVIADSKTKLSRGFGFVTYAKTENVDECLAAGPHTIDGRTVDVKRAVPKQHSHVGDDESPRSKKVFMGGLPLSITEEEIEEVMVEFGEVEEVVIIREKTSSTPRGFGFVIYKEFESAASACQKKHIKFKNYRDRDIEVKAAVSVDEMKRTGRDKDRRMPPFDRDDRGYNRGGRHDNYYDGGRPSHRDDRFEHVNRPYFSEPQGYHGVGGNAGGYGDRDPLYSSDRSGYGMKPYAPVLDRVGGYSSGPGDFGSYAPIGQPEGLRGYEPREYDSGVYSSGTGAGVYGPGSGGYGSGPGSGGYGTGPVSGGYGTGPTGPVSGGYGNGSGGYGSVAGAYGSTSGGYSSYTNDYGSSVGPIKSHVPLGRGGGGGTDARSSGPYGGMGVHPSTGGYGGVRNPAGGSHGFHPYRR